MVHYASIEAALADIRSMHNYDETEHDGDEYCRDCKTTVSGVVVPMTDNETWFVCKHAHASRIE